MKQIYIYIYIYIDIDLDLRIIYLYIYIYIYIYIYRYLIFNNLKQWDNLVIVFILVNLVQWGRNGSNGSIK